MKKGCRAKIPNASERRGPPREIGKYIGLVGVNFEGRCETMNLEQSSWLHKLLALIPSEAAGVVAHLSKTRMTTWKTKLACSGVSPFNRCTPAAIPKYTLNVGQGYCAFSNDLQANVMEGLKSADVYVDHHKVIESVVLEQIHCCITEILASGQVRYLLSWKGRGARGGVRSSQEGKWG